jgi:adenylate cyclase
MTAASPKRSAFDHRETTIDVVVETETTSVPQPNSSNGGALTTTKGTFSAFLAPLTKDTFRRVVSDVEGKLKVVNQTLSILDNVLESQGFDAILDEMLRSITLKTGELLGADRTTIYLLDEEKNELWSIVAKGNDGAPLEIRIPVGKGIAGEVAASKDAIHIDYDFYDDPRSFAAKEFDKKNGYRTYTMLALPLLNDSQELVAVVQLINKLKSPHDPEFPLGEKIDQNGFTEVDRQLFEEFAPSIRLILESSRSFYKATQRQRAASALMSATRSLSQAGLDLEDTLKKVMDEAQQLMNADRSTLWLLDSASGQLWTKIPIAGEMKEFRIPMDVGFAGQVATTGEPLIIPFDLYNHPNSETSKETDQKTHYRTCSMLCMPVFNGDGELIGVTQLINKKKQGDFPEYNPKDWPKAPECWNASFNRNDQEFMQAFNIQAGVALQNAQLFATVKQQEQMQRDMLRSLSNGVISIDNTGKVIAANEKAKQLVGLKAGASLEGEMISELVKIKEGDFSRWLNDALEAVDDKARQQYYPDQTLLSAVGVEQHSVNLSVNSIADASDASNVYGVLVVMDDISDEKRLKSTMYRYMTQELAEELLRLGDTKLGGDRKEVSILFSDIRGYTTLTEQLEAEEVVRMLNEYFESMVEAVFAHKGTLDKYIGDAIMAVFGSPLPLKDHAWRSVQTALDMRQRLEEFNMSRRQDHKPAIRIGIGINSGTVISGNIGSSKRMEFTAIGDDVNLSSRLEGASKQYGCDIVISEKTLELCSQTLNALKGGLRVRELDKIIVKGKTQPVSIYEVVGLQSDPIPSDKEDAIERYHKGRQYYLQRKFRQAWNEFAFIVEEIDFTDKAARLQMERSQHFVNNPPTEDWDGVWTLTQK